jgi:DNA-binding transcriptional MerR regulator
MHPFSHVYALFVISPTTLHRWCRHAHITPHIDPVDNRRRYLDDNQLLRLARLHYRVLVVNTGSVQISAIEKLEARIAKLEKERQDIS